MRRHLPRLLLTGALLFPAALYAMGLGEIRLNSALNQPFDADIEVIAPTREELAELKVGLASNEFFSRYGLDRPAFLSSFDFSVTRSRDGQVTVKVRSNRSVTEPFVRFLVEANWGRGRVLREYTVLLDPPTFLPAQPEQAAPVTAPQSGARNEGRIERVPQPAPAAEPARPVSAPEPGPAGAEPVAQTPSSVAPGGTYTVERNDTLSQIAAKVQPGSPRRVINQTMIAVFRANPAAFADNINRLRAGSVLRIPEYAEIDAIPSDEATAEVARQKEAWAGGTLRTPGQNETDRLVLVPPQQTSPAPAPAVTPTPPVEATPRESTAPTTAPPATDRRLPITNPGLANAQQNATPAPATQPEPPAPTAEQQPVAEPPQEAAPEEPAPPPKAAARPKPKAAPKAPEPSFFERIGDFWLVPVIAGLILLVALVLVFLKRRREASEMESLDYPPMTFEPRVERSAPAPAFGQSAPKARERESFLVETESEEPSAFDEPAPITSRRPEPRTRPVEPRALEPEELSAPTTPKRPVASADDTLSSETAVRFDQQDALAEADFHMAYGLYDQAADLVKIAIGREPARRDLKLKLLEIYFVWGNRELFLDTARELYATRDQAASGEWDKVLIMGKQIAPEDSMFKMGGGATTHVDLVDVNLEGGENRVDVDLFAESDGGEALDLEFGSGTRKGPGSSSSDLDFMLNDERLDEGDEPTREMDQLSRTQETPTIESPMLDRTAQTVRERVDRAAFNKSSAEQTAELSLDDLGLDVESLETTGSLEETASLESDTAAADADARPLRAEARDHTLRDDEMTQLAPSLGSMDRTLEAPRVESFDVESTGTVYIDQVDLSGGDTVEQPRPDVDATASMKGPRKMDLNLDSFDNEDTRFAETVRAPGRPETEADRFSQDVFSERTGQFSKADLSPVDLDVGEALAAEDREPTNKVVTTEMELSELEPVTMSEVGTKLDLARAYMDMGDPDGARSILEEVLQEGTANQKQEAQRLLESIR